MSHSNGEGSSVKEMLGIIHQDLQALRKEVHDDRVARDNACMAHMKSVGSEIDDLKRWRFYTSGGIAALSALAYAWKEEIKQKIGMK